MIKQLAVVVVVSAATLWTISATAVSATDAASAERVATSTDLAAAVASAPYPLAAATEASVATEVQATLPQPHIAPDTRDASVWRGETRRAANVRRGPFTSAAVVRELAAGTPVRVGRWVPGETVESDNPTWAEIGPDEFVYGMALRPGALPAPVTRADRAGAGKWIDVDLTHQIVTAYEGEKPVHTTFASTGRPSWETPTGTWRILRRVADETMDGGTLAGQGSGGKGASYHVEHVRWTQYFTADGSAIHENYWRDPATIGVPGSHGCIGLAPTEAAWFWSWATTGTTIIVHA